MSVLDGTGRGYLLEYVRSTGTSSVRYRFGQFEIDSVRYELSCAGQRIATRPKVFELLRYLVEHPEQLITHKELIDSVWAGQAVSSTTVPWTVGHARKALKQRAGEKGPIETVHARGYRFRAAVEALGSGSIAPAAGSGTPFVGREPLMASLVQRLERTQVASAGGLLVLVGDAGIGKTRCLDELSVSARALGFRVWSGRSTQGALGPVYAPLLKALRSAHAESPANSQLVKILSLLAAESEPLEEREAALARLALFEAVSAFLAQCGREKPWLFIFDDLHWSDSGTLELLNYVSADLRNARVLIVAGSRAAPSTPTSGGESIPMRHAERFDVLPLARSDVAEYLQAISDKSKAAPELCEALFRASAGYPLFLEEAISSVTARYGREELAKLPVSAVGPGPHALELLRARVAALSTATQHVLACASMLGDQPEVADVALLARQPQAAVVRALDEAHRDGFLSEMPSQRLHFRHELHRQVVYDQLPLGERMRYHRAIADMLLARADAAARKAEIAHHFYRSLELGDPARVRTAVVEAAHAAAAVASFADAAQFAAWALEAIAVDPLASPREYAELLLFRAHAQRCAGRFEDGHVTAGRAVEAAAQHGYTDLLVRAARALRWSHAAATVPDPLALRALERVIELVPDDADSRRLQALSMLAWLPPVAYDLALSKQQSAAALALARRDGNRETVGEALTARLYALSGPDDIDLKLSVANEILALDRRSESRSWLTVEAFIARNAALLHRGQLAAAEAEIAALRAIATEAGYLEVRWFCDRIHTQYLMATGAFNAAEQQLARLEQDATRIGLRDGPALVFVLRVSLLSSTVGPSALEKMDVAHLRARLHPQAHPGMFAWTGRIDARAGRIDAARSALDALAADGFADVPKNLGYLNALSQCAMLAVELEDRERAERLYQLLESFPGHETPNLVLLSEGPVAFYLGLLAAFLDQAGALKHFELAASLCEERGLQPMLARSQLELARCLARSADVDSRPQAAEARDRAIRAAEAVGMDWCAEAARQLNCCRNNVDSIS